ncbi:hypothetical protein [Deinococcus multiflagellatus]|uniref:Uncharacterized protein n=1 Tax=Deinococcus multiflagellatus TaxID=1656887 RepID=A0ABW1ZQZ0_9DEIO
MANTAVSQAFALSFGLNTDVPVRLRVAFTNRFQLVAVSGPVSRSPSTDEVQGVGMGVVTTLSVLFQARPLITDLSRPRVTDA